MQARNDPAMHTRHTIPKDDGSSVQCEIFAYGNHGIPQEQLITALWEAAETFSLNEVHREQIELNLSEAQGMFTFTNRFHQADGRPLNVRLHVCVQQDSYGQSIKGYIESTEADTPAASSLCITYLAPFDATLRPIAISSQIETLLGFSPAHWRTMPNLWERQLHLADRQRVLTLRQQCYVTEQPFCCEYRLLSSDGRLVWLREEAIPVTNGGQYPQYMEGLLLDITRRKSYEAQYHQGLKPSPDAYQEEADSAADAAPLLSQAVGQV